MGSSAGNCDLDLVDIEDEEIEKLKENNANNLTNNSFYSLDMKSEFKEENENGFIDQGNQFDINESNDEKEGNINYNTNEEKHIEELPFKCNLCNKSYKQSISLAYHMTCHPGKHDSHCEVCGQSGFTLQSAFRAHMLTHSKDKPYVCHICGRGFLHSSHLKLHMDIHSDVYPFQCEQCDTKCKTKWALTQHSLTHEAQQFQCEICFKVFKSKKSMKAHLKTHKDTEEEGQDQQTHSCDQCGKTYKHRYSLQCHMRCHTDGLFKCDICDKSYTRRNTLQDHMRTHAGERTFECEICNQKYITKGCLTAHKKIHDSTWQTFKCDMCDKVLATKKSLRAHRVHVHSTETNHQCDLCQQKFKGRYSLTKHLRTHRRESLAIHQEADNEEQNQQTHFKCHICNKLYFMEASLHVHLQQHAEEAKLFKCEICKKNFSTSSSLDLHKTTDHSNKCDVCQRVFESNNSMRIHRKLKHFAQPIACKLCGLKMKKNKMKAHLSKHKKKGELIENHSEESNGVAQPEDTDHIESVCEVCHVDCSAEGLEVHMSTHDVKPFQCECFMVFFGEGEYKKHLKDDCEVVKSGLKVTEDFKVENVVKEELEIGFEGIKKEFYD